MKQEPNHWQLLQVATFKKADSMSQFAYVVPFPVPGVAEMFTVVVVPVEEAFVSLSGGSTFIRWIREDINCPGKPAFFRTFLPSSMTIQAVPWDQAMAEAQKMAATLRDKGELAQEPFAPFSDQKKGADPKKDHEFKKIAGPGSKP